MNGRTYHDPDDGGVKLEGVPIFNVLAELARARPDLKPVVRAADLTQSQYEAMRRNGWVPQAANDEVKPEPTDPEVARIGALDQAAYEAWRRGQG